MLGRNLMFARQAVLNWAWDPVTTGCVLSQGNLAATALIFSSCIGTKPATTSPKTCWEVTIQSIGGNDCWVGFANTSFDHNSFPGGDANSFGLRPNGEVWSDGAVIATGGTFGVGDAVTVCLGAGGAVEWYRNGISIYSTAINHTYPHFGGANGAKATLRYPTFMPAGFTPLV